MSRRLSIVNVNANLCYVSGYGSRELLTDLGRVPCWSALGRAWAVSRRTGVDVAAYAETRGYAVTVTEDDPLPALTGRLW